MRNYYIVTAKCGHVGKNMYIPLDFAIWAENAREAASIARQRPGVKCSHPDAILAVKKITKEEYYKVKQPLKDDFYWHKDAMSTKSNQAIFFTMLMPETTHHAVHKRAISQRNIEKVNKIASRQFRYRKILQLERSLCSDIAREYGVSV